MLEVTRKLNILDDSKGGLACYSDPALVYGYLRAP